MTDPHDKSERFFPRFSCMRSGKRSTKGLSRSRSCCLDYIDAWGPSCESDG